MLHCVYFYCFSYDCFKSCYVIVSFYKQRVDYASNFVCVSWNCGQLEYISHCNRKLRSDRVVRRSAFRCYAWWIFAKCRDRRGSRCAPPGVRRNLPQWRYQHVNPTVQVSKLNRAFLSRHRREQIQQKVYTKRVSCSKAHCFCYSDFLLSCYQ